MLLYAGHLLKFSCADCQKYVFDLKDGTQQFHEIGDGEKVPSERCGTLPPCKLGEKCAKESPEREHEHLLTERGWKILACYKEHRACGPDPRHPPDDVRRWAFAIVDSVYRNYEAQQLALNVARIFAGSRE